MKLFDFLNSINYDKKALLDIDEKSSELYNSYLVNRCMSFFPDTLFHSNEMNCNWDIDKKMQFDFYRFAVRKKKRYSKWIKKETSDDIELIKEVYNYTDAKAQEVLNILGPGDLDKLKQSLEKGGFNNKE
jgi:hypothetical protein